MENKGQGLFIKYDVTKADTKETVGNCFVLRPDRDKAAAYAMFEYARTTDNRVLAKDIEVWMQCLGIEDDRRVEAVVEKESMTFLEVQEEIGIVSKKVVILEKLAKEGSKGIGVRDYSEDEGYAYVGYPPESLTQSFKEMADSYSKRLEVLKIAEQKANERIAMMRVEL